MAGLSIDATLLKCLYNGRIRGRGIRRAATCGKVCKIGGSVSVEGAECGKDVLTLLNAAELGVRRRYHRDWMD